MAVIFFYNIFAAYMISWVDNAIASQRNDKMMKMTLC
jgi:hypothetical protein